MTVLQDMRVKLLCRWKQIIQHYFTSKKAVFSLVPNKIHIFCWRNLLYDLYLDDSSIGMPVPADITFTNVKCMYSNKKRHRKHVLLNILGAKKIKHKEKNSIT